MKFEKEYRILSLVLLMAFMTSPFLGDLATPKLSEASVRTAQAMSVMKIDINKAGVDELMQLKGVGKTVAERIVNYRKENGSFKSSDDLKKIKGIGGKRFEKIKDNIKL